MEKSARLVSSCCLSICLSLTLHIVALELVYRAKSCTSVFLAGMFLFVHWYFCCRTYRLATKRTAKNEWKKTRAWVFFRHIRPCVHWFIAHYLLLRTWVRRGWVNLCHELWSSRLSGFSVCVHKWTVGMQSNSSIPANRRPKLVTAI